MLEKIISLILQEKLLSFSLFFIILLIIKNYRLKRKNQLLKNKIFWLEVKDQQEENTKLNQLTREFKEVTRKKNSVNNEDLQDSNFY
ncbi:hypothetical protein D2A30_01915 [Streptococcus suis]|uniref:hypothetical protein n=1 Tax=Streptococcus parasuis TaxID=1501662 RepID=UPI001EF8A393|nr:hypothetical protein [Streptococcus suis]ULL20442.1 hypothetical protein D2A30_01915 [Streptococcus suis]